MFPGDDAYPAWFEIVAGSDSLWGRFQGRSGRATRVGNVKLTGNRFDFHWFINEGSGAKAATVSGVIDRGEGIRGIVTDTLGRKTPFTGLRAPTLVRSHPPEWDKPIDLLSYGMNGWQVRGGGRNGWTLQGGVLANQTPGSDLLSRLKFGDFKLRIEAKIPPGGNSGIYLRGRYEVQVSDDPASILPNQRIGAIYGQVVPSGSAAKPAAEWQVFDITLVGRRVTVVLNGTTVIDDQEIPGITGGALDSDEGAPGPILLQGDHTTVQYRNIVLTPARLTR
jgi:hypothetical protein